MTASPKSTSKPGGSRVAGARVGPYRLVEPIASGGMAEIFLARGGADGGFSKELVLKVLQARFGDDDAIVQMFLDEGRLGAVLSHPCVVDVYDAGEDAGAHFIAMEHIRGKTLTEVVLRAIEVGRPLPLPLSAFIVLQVAEGLAYLQRGIDPDGAPLHVVHRDLSPMNLVVGVSGQTKIIDFGIAKRGTSVKEESGARPGKVSYMSPEQVRGLALDGRSDLFSLGTILYELTVGRRLWRGAPEVAMRRVVEETPPPPTYVRRDYPPALELVVLKALAKRPEDRYASADELADDLEAYLLETGERIGTRQIARFLHDLFAPGTKSSEQGAARARAFLDDERDGGDVLDFDRPFDDRPGAAFARAVREGGRRGESPQPPAELPAPAPSAPGSSSEPAAPAALAEMPDAPAPVGSPAAADERARAATQAAAIEAPSAPPGRAGVWLYTAAAAAAAALAGLAWAIAKT
jgi:serine/threonine-protein kinase